MISKNALEELYEILSYMDKLTVMKIPEDILNNINKRRNRSFMTKIDKNDIFNRQNMSGETLNLLCYIDYNYWMDKDKKSEAKEALRKKEIEIEKEKRKKYNPNQLFKKISKAHRKKNKNNNI